MSNVEVGFSSVIGDKHFTVLERVHRAGVNVEVRIELLHDDSQTTTGEQIAERCGCQTFAEGGNNTTGHENVPCYDPPGVKICIPHHGI